MKNKKLGILLVEDDQVDVMNVQRAFKRNNIVNPLYVAGNGLEALAMLRGEAGGSLHQPNIILLDLSMPKMGGIEFLKILRADPALRSTRVFVLTTSNEDQDRVDAYDLNVAGYILKPVGMDSFIQAVATLDLYWSLNEL